MSTYRGAREFRKQVAALARGIGVAKHVYCGGEDQGEGRESHKRWVVIDEQNNGTARAISFFYISLALDAKQ